MLDDEVEQLRLDRKLSQAALAERADVHPNTIGNVESGISESGVLTLFKIADGLKIPLSELICGVQRRKSRG